MPFNRTTLPGLFLLGLCNASCASREVTFQIKTPATMQACLGASLDELYQKALEWRSFTGLDPAAVEVKGESLPPEDMRRFFYRTSHKAILHLLYQTNPGPNSRSLFFRSS
jgi:hypothetical protein